MHIAEIMSAHPDTIDPDARITQAAQLMRENKRRFLPVSTADGKLVGLLSHREIAKAEPSAITSLSVGEINYLASKVTVKQLMVRELVTCSPRTLVEDAGTLMREHRIGCLPVTDGGQLVGIVTQTDILDFLLNIMGCRLANSHRVAVRLPNKPRSLANFLLNINDRGGYIAAVVAPVSEIENEKRATLVRYLADQPQQLQQQLQEQGYEFID